MAWTDERVEQLRRYWDEGHSASKIAELLGDGLSRNAVIGKAHRLGLAARPSPLKTSPAAKTARSKTAKTKAAKAATVAKPATDAARKADGATETKPPAAAAKTPATKAAEPAPAPAAAPVKSTPVAASPATPAAAPAPAEKPLAAEAAASTPAARSRAKKGRVTLLDLNDRICRWPIGHPDKANFHFCGKPVNPGFPYCPDHCLEAYQAQMPRKDRAAPGQPNAPRNRFGSNLPRPR